MQHCLSVIKNVEGWSTAQPADPTRAEAASILRKVVPYKFHHGPGVQPLMWRPQSSLLGATTPSFMERPVSAPPYRGKPEAPPWNNYENYERQPEVGNVIYYIGQPYSLEKAAHYTDCITIRSSKQTHHHITSHGENRSRPQGPLYPRNNTKIRL